MRRKKTIRKISDHIGIILITLTMIMVKLNSNTCSSWRLDWSVPKDKEAAEKKTSTFFECSNETTQSD